MVMQCVTSALLNEDSVPPALTLLKAGSHLWKCSPMAEAERQLFQLCHLGPELFLYVVLLDCLVMTLLSSAVNKTEEDR